MWLRLEQRKKRALTATVKEKEKRTMARESSGVRARARPPRALTSPVKQYSFLFLMKRANNFLAQITDFRLKKILFIVSFQSSFQVPE